MGGEKYRRKRERKGGGGAHSFLSLLLCVSGLHPYRIGNMRLYMSRIPRYVLQYVKKCS